MVDREARHKMAALLRHFIAGLITNDDLCNNLPASKTDRSVGEIETALQVDFEGIFCKPYKLGHNAPLSREDRRELARISMFLYTDFDTARSVRPQWLDAVDCLGRLLLLPLLVPYAIFKYVWDWLRGKPECRHSDDFWPFASRADYEEALRHPKLLCG